MHVWIVADTSRNVPGGMLRHMELHAEGLKRLGERATLLLAEDMAESPLPRGLKLPGARSLAALLTRCRAERPTIVNVHTQCAPAWIVARRAGLIGSAVVVMSYAADEPQVVKGGARGVLRWAKTAVPARLTYPHASGVWCVNEQDRRYYLDEYHLRPEQVRRFPHAVADSFYSAAAGLARRPERLLFVGTWIRRKGVDVLAAALERVVLARPSVEVVLAGTIVAASEVLGALAPSVRERTTVYERVGDRELAELYRSSALLLIPSRVEGLPITMLEAMAAGCPALAAANSGMLDAISPGKNGFLEESFEPERWAARILELLSDPVALSAASAGASAAAETYRIEPVAERVAAWYRTLASA